MDEPSSPSIGARILAVLVLAVGAWFLLKVVIGIVTGIAWMVAVIVAVIAVVWAFRTLFQTATPTRPVAFLVICFFFGLAGGVIGRIKGSSFLLWFVLSAIPPFAGLLAAILYRVERDEPVRACPGCGKIVPVYQALCTRCGTELEFPEPGSAAPPGGPAAVH